MTEPPSETAAPAKANHVWFLFFLAVFLGWLGFLIYEALTSANPVILSRPQFLAASVVAQGSIKDEPLRLVVSRVWWGPSSLRNKELLLTKRPTFHGEIAAEMIVPLADLGGGRYSPQGLPPGMEIGVDAQVNTAYPVTAPVEAQLVEILHRRRKGNPAEEAP